MPWKHCASTELHRGPCRGPVQSCRPWKIDPDPMEESDVGVLHFKDTFQCARDRHGLRTAWSLMSCACETTVVFLPNRSMASIQTLSSMCWMCMSCRLEIHVFVDKDQHARKSELCWSLSSTLLARCRCRDVAPNVSLVNEVQCGTGTEWRDLIGQQCVGKEHANFLTQVPQDNGHTITHDWTGSFFLPHDTEMGL